MINTKFYQFRQNNSGGSFEHEENPGIGITVIIEAVDHLHANAKAQMIGLYFNGCDNGQDCECCGDRWYAVDSYDGDAYPMIYGDKVRAVTDEEEPYLDWDLPSYLHTIDGNFSKVIKDYL